MSVFDPESPPAGGWRAKVYEVVFGTETRAGWWFDTVLLVAILLSVVAISLETVEAMVARYGRVLKIIEWVMTVIFTVEYALRLICVRRAKDYALSFMGIVDLVSVLPTYLALFFAATPALQILRALRLLRVFRVFQVGTMTEEGAGLYRGLLASRYKISVFLGTVMIIVVIQGALLYFLEHEVNEGFTSIPRAIYWAIVTLTTVGYGDISPVTIGGQFIASVLMLLGYGIIAVPTGIVTAEVALSEYIRREGERGGHEPVVALPAAAPNTCAGPVPARLVVHGAAASVDGRASTVEAASAVTGHVDVDEQAGEAEEQVQSVDARDPAGPRHAADAADAADEPEAVDAERANAEQAEAPPGEAQAPQETRS
ncbi:ion transporter [Pseudenhygromyxa sp. WMMC2535]|uniref:ion transporter n=1 Tax=Pseudenhygromyxa sp. WMMC2535 TaxID=2712867 RepID=UPI001552F814|nr:ion transporter [Pseudenhygromyxa sp. WMMC2535]